MEKIPTSSQGVQQLIDRLRDEGVQAGREEADRIIREAEARAAEVVQSARAEADDIRGAARKAIQEDDQAARAALQMAIRDTKLKLKAEIMALFSVQLKRLVTQQLCDQDFLQSVILTIAGRARAEIPDERPLEILIPGAQLDRESGETSSAAGKEDPLETMVLAISTEMLREGVELRPSQSLRSGIRIRLDGQDMEIDLSDEAVSDLLLAHMLPRLRAVAEGVGL